MAHGEVKHDYHLVDPSPWPIVGSVGAFVMAVGAIFFFKGGNTLSGCVFGMEYSLALHIVNSL